MLILQENLLLQLEGSKNPLSRLHKDRNPLILLLLEKSK